LEKELLLLGFTDDNLVQQGLVFNEATGKFYSACPLIALHHTISGITSPRDLNQKKSLMLQILEQFQTERGYWHTEKVVDQISYVREMERTFDSTILFPCSPFNAQPGRYKKWDIHIKVAIGAISEVERLVLLGLGFYYITRFSEANGVRQEWYSFTVQGSSPPREGKKIFGAIMKWWKEAGLPTTKAKFEVTLNSDRFNNPDLVPPVIDKVVWLKS
jgi:hypothetical protein